MIPGFKESHVDQVVAAIFLAGTAGLSMTSQPLAEEDQRPLVAFAEQLTRWCSEQPDVVDDALEQVRHRMAHGPEYHPASGWTVERAVVVLTEAQRLCVKMT